MSATLASILALLMIGAGCAAAVSSQPARATAQPAPSPLSTGFVEDSLLLEYPPPVSVPPMWSQRMLQLGSSWDRIGVDWNDIVSHHPPKRFDAANPADPNYNWWYLDKAVRDATAYGQHVLLTLEYPPSWAIGKAPPGTRFAGSWRPSISAVAAFAHALAERYSGRFSDPARPGETLPRVGYFQAWNEPNLPGFLMPQWTRTRNGWMPSGGDVYRGLLNAFYAAVKAVQPSSYVLAGGLAPYGDPAGDGRMSPVTFLANLLCLQGANLARARCPDPAHFDAIDIHAYGTSPTTPAHNAADVSIPDIAKLRRVLQAAGRSRRMVPQAAKPIWATEIDWDSNPPDREGVSLTRQAQYVALTFYELWRQAVTHVMWYEIRDLGSMSNVRSGFGLYYENGNPKPSVAAFRFPFVALRSANRGLTLWGRAPAPGPVDVQSFRAGRWRTLTRLGTTSGGVFYARRRLGSHLLLRAKMGTVASSSWPTG